MSVPKDFKELLECFNAHRVEYLVIGAYALSFHGAPRFTGDIDLLVNPDTENAKRVIAALAEFGFPSLGLKPDDLNRPDQIIQLGVRPVRADIVTSIGGVSWEQAWESRAQGTISGVPVFFIGREQFVINKRAAGRLKDLADLEALGEDV